MPWNHRLLYLSWIKYDYLQDIQEPSISPWLIEPIQYPINVELEVYQIQYVTYYMLHIKCLNLSPGKWELVCPSNQFSLELVCCNSMHLILVIWIEEFQVHWLIEHIQVHIFYQWSKSNSLTYRYLAGIKITYLIDNPVRDFGNSKHCIQINYGIANRTCIECCFWCQPRWNAQIEPLQY